MAKKVSLKVFLTEFITNRLPDLTKEDDLSVVDIENIVLLFKLEYNKYYNTEWYILSDKDYTNIITLLFSYIIARQKDKTN